MIRSKYCFFKTSSTFLLIFVKSLKHHGQWCRKRKSLLSFIERRILNMEEILWGIQELIIYIFFVYTVRCSYLYTHSIKSYTKSVKIWTPHRVIQQLLMTDVISILGLIYISHHLFKHTFHSSGQKVSTFKQTNFKFHIKACWFQISKNSQQLINTTFFQYFERVKLLVNSFLGCKALHT